MQALGATFVLASALLGACGAFHVAVPGLADQQNGPGHLSSIVEVIETTLVIGNPTHRASGVLLSPQFVLTTQEAAGAPGWGKGRHVVVGRGSGGDGVSVEIADRYEHPVGVLLLKLKDEVHLNAVTKPANLPHNDTDNTGAGALLASWTGAGKAKAPKSSSVSVLTEAECAAKGVASGLCSEGVEACDGDEGSPLVQDLKNGIYKLVGLVRGVQDAKECVQTVAYYDVAEYSSWILGKMFDD